MGCDIHCYREKLINGKWLSADKWEDEYNEGRLDVPYEQRFTDRNYRLFGLLSSGVREEYPFSLEPRGLPFDVSIEVKTISDVWEGDGHSHSYVYLHELKSLKEFLKTATVKVTGMKDKEGLLALKESVESENPDWNLLYPFCGWTNVEGAVRFEYDVPASFIIGNSLEKLIKLFDGLDGENHRIVFWFDN